MTRFVSAFVLALMLFAGFAARADERPKPDDTVMLDLSAEDWVTTKTARVTINVEAAVNGNNAGAMRADMMKAVNDLIKTDWRLTDFSRSQDQTGLERWSATYEARIPEGQLNGLGENAKKASKAGMQLTVGDIDFSPTLEEMETARAALRAQIYKQANDQLAAVNAAIPGRSYRIAMINFTGEEPPMPPRPMMRAGGVRNMAMMASVAPVPASATGSVDEERAQKVNLTARVIFAAVVDKAPSADTKH